MFLTELYREGLKKELETIINSKISMGEYDEK